ncbi:hypothetical protein BYT27DRAFT_6692902 [Phlegmacium glaucopus]|nr:hypothetical protein BYT27DRAFT_6692902 [Phlegmacium glaucopus]
MSLSATSSSFGNPSSALATSPRTGHRDWEPTMTSIPEDGSQKSKKKSVESLHEILRRAQTMLVSENWFEDAKSIELKLDLRTPRITPLSDSGKVNRVAQLEKAMQEIITAAQCALDALNAHADDAIQPHSSGSTVCRNV